MTYSPAAAPHPQPPFALDHPALPFLLAGCLALGTLLPPASRPLVVVLAAALLLGWTLGTFWRLVFLAFLFVAAGALLAAPPTPPSAASHVYRRIGDGGEYSLAGRLQGLPVIDDDGLRFTLEVHQVDGGSGPQPAHGLVRLYLPAGTGSPPPDLVPGADLAVRAWLRPRLASRNPGLADGLARRDIWVSGRVLSPAYLTVLAPPRGWTGAVDRLRLTIRHRLVATLGPEESGLARALLIGDRGGITPELRQDFSRAGINHLLAISGLHLGLLGLAAYWATLFLLRAWPPSLLLVPGPKTAALVALIPMAAYALLAGGGPPVRRALVMTSAAGLALVLDRRHAVFHAALLAALLLVLIDPPTLRSPSFQLTFAAILGIALYHRPIAAFFRRFATGSSVAGWLADGLAVSLAATVATGPIVLYHFNALSPYGPLATILAAPLFCFWSLPLGFAGLLLAPLWPAGATLLLQAAGAGLSLTLALVRLIRLLPGSLLHAPSPPPLVVLALLVLLAAVRFHRRYPMARLIGGAALTVLACTLAWDRYQAAHLPPSLTCLDVGHGSAVLVHLPAVGTVVVDAGGMRRPGFDVGRRVVAPVLWRQGSHRLAGMVITHPHADHYNGVPFLLEQFRPPVLYVASDQGPPGYLALLRQARRLGIRLVVVRRDRVLFGQGDTVLEGLAGTGGTGNEDGLVVRVRHGRDKILIPGDVGRRRQRQLAQRPDIAAVALLASHHGRDQDPVFEAAVAARWRLVSTADRRPRQAGEFSTRECGALTVRWTADGLRLAGENPRCGEKIRRR